MQPSPTQELKLYRIGRYLPPELKPTKKYI